MAKKYDSKFIEDTIPKAPGYWISPQGQIFKLTDKKLMLNLKEE